MGNVLQCDAPHVGALMGIRHHHHVAVTHAVPMFRHAHEALRWAFSRRPVIDSAWPNMMHEKVETGEITSCSIRSSLDFESLPSGMDGIAQAGMILALVEAIPDKYEKMAIIARYGRRKAPETIKAMIYLIPAARNACGTGIHHHKMIDGLVQRYFGRRVRMKDLAFACGVHANTVYAKWRSIRSKLSDLETRAYDRVNELMTERGLIAAVD